MNKIKNATENKLKPVSCETGGNQLRSVVGPAAMLSQGCGGQADLRRKQLVAIRAGRVAGSVVSRFHRANATGEP